MAKRTRFKEAQTAKRFELWDVDAAMLIDRNVDLADFAVSNDLASDDLNQISRLNIGAAKSFGGGAAPLFALRRAE